MTDPVVQPGSLVPVTMLVSMSEADLGGALVTPAGGPAVGPAKPGDTVSVDQATADRWIAAGIAEGAAH